MKLLTDTVFEQIMAMRRLPNCPNLFDVKAVFELALEQEMDSLADYVFSSTDRFVNFILTGKRD